MRVACRRPNESLFVKPYGTVGQVEPIQCNIRDEASTRAVIAGADAVVNCVGVLWESGKNSFDATQAAGAGRIARIAADVIVAISAGQRLVNLGANNRLPLKIDLQKRLIRTVGAPVLPV